jgi:3-isopropylmalate/(R)-2-methylmalate dehydratase large subunit
MAAKTLFEKIWEEHVVHEEPHHPSLLYIDLHLIHEVTSPQAFAGLRDSGRKIRAPHRTYATMDHNVPTTNRSLPIADPDSKLQVETLRRNCEDFGIKLYDLGSREQGIIHVIGPELGLTQPGMTIVCGDSHTATHGAFGALAFGIGTSEVEHVLATQCLWEERPQTFEIRVDGKLGAGVGAKDLILGIIGRITTNGATGHVIEYRGSAVEALSMEERMTVCNMSIEAGARAGMVAADKTTVEYLRGRRYVPSGKDFEQLTARWLQCRSDDGAKFDRSVTFDAASFAPQVTWGTNPGMVTDVRGSVPNPGEIADPAQRGTVERALDYMALKPGTRIEDIKIDRVFIGSCTNSRLTDL